MQLVENVALNDKTTLKVGGPARFFVSAQTEEEVGNAVLMAKEKELAIRVLGGGSNILVPDVGFDGLVIKNDISHWEEEVAEDHVCLTVGAGDMLDTVVEKTVEKEYWGLENLSHIPGSIGATPVQNVGAYGVEVKDLISSVRVLDIDTGEIQSLSTAACKFGYRDSLFKHPEGKKYIVLAVTFKLNKRATPKLTYKDLATRFADTSPSIQEIRDAIIEIRAGKFPDWQQVGTAGSFFKNPIIEQTAFEKLRGTYPELPGFAVSATEVKVALGWILEHVCGLKGVTQGHVGTYEGQALVLVHDGQASAHDIESFATFAAQNVFDKTGITIEWEVTRLI